MIFFDNDLNRRRVEDVRSISAGRTERYGGQDRWVHDVRLLDGTEIVLLDVIVAQISKIPAHVVPAEPGGYVFAGEDEDGTDMLLPIIAWSVAIDGNIYPLTAGGSIDDMNAGAVIVMPNGEVVRNGLRQHPSLAAYKTSCSTN
jgi:hypothetical protein